LAKVAIVTLVINQEIDGINTYIVGTRRGLLQLSRLRKGERFRVIAPSMFFLLLGWPMWPVCLVVCHGTWKTCSRRDKARLDVL